MLIGFICWVALGLITGFIATKFVKLRNDDPKVGIAVGACGGVVVAGVFSAITTAGAAGFNLWSLLFAALGAILTLVTWHTVRNLARRPATSRRSW